MADIAAVFFLVAILHGSGDTFSITQLATFSGEDACGKAVEAMYSALSGADSKAAEIGCIAGDKIQALKGR